MAFTTKVWLSDRVYLRVCLCGGGFYMYVGSLVCDPVELVFLSRIRDKNWIDRNTISTNSLHSLLSLWSVRNPISLSTIFFSYFLPSFVSRRTREFIFCNPAVRCPSKNPLKCLWFQVQVYLPVHYHRCKWCIVEWSYYTLLSSLCWETVWKAKSVNSSYLHYIILY